MESQHLEIRKEKKEEGLWQCLAVASLKKKAAPKEKTLPETQASF